MTLTRVYPRVARSYALLVAIALLSSIVLLAPSTRADANETKSLLLLPEAPDKFATFVRTFACDDFAGCLNETPVNDANTTIVVGLSGSLHVDLRLQNVSESLSIGTIYSITQWIWARKNSSGNPQFSISLLSSDAGGPGCSGYGPSLTEAFANFSTTISDPAPCGSNATWTTSDINNLVYRFSIGGGPTAVTTVTSVGLVVTYSTPCVASSLNPLPTCAMTPLIQIIIAVMTLMIILGVFSAIVGILFGLSKRFEVRK